LNEDELVTGGERSDENTSDEELSDEEIYDVSTALCVDS